MMTALGPQVSPMHSRRAVTALLLLALASCGEDKTTTPTTVVPTTPLPGTPPAAANRTPSVRISDFQPRTTAVAGGTHVSFGSAASDPDGDSLTYTWDFGDGTTGSGHALFHVFYASGSFDVKVTVSDGRGGSATDTVRVDARRIEGEWRLENAAHVTLTARISQGNGSNRFWGTVSDGSLIEGRLLDPYGAELTYSSATALCIPSGTYTGNVFTGVDVIVFDGPGCRGFSLRR
jgi:hypothetical protein